VPRLLVVLPVVLAALVAAGGAGSARLDDPPDVTVRASGNGQYDVTVQNTSTTLVINSFTFAPGPALTVSGVVRSDAGTCAMSGSTFSCSGLSLGIYHCGCNPGGLVTVTFTGAGDGAGSGVSGLGTSPAPPDSVTTATTAKPTATTTKPAGSAASGDVKITIADVNGRVIRTLDGPKAAGIPSSL